MSKFGEGQGRTYEVFWTRQGRLPFGKVWGEGGFRQESRLGYRGTGVV